MKRFGQAIVLGALSALLVGAPVACRQAEDAPPVEKAHEGVPMRADQKIRVERERSLRDQLSAFRNRWALRVPDRQVELYETAIRDLRESGICERALSVGDRAPDFVLPDAHGEMVQLYDLVKRGPVVLVWYRGGWCPYCNLTLHVMQQKLPRFTELGATLVAVSPQTPDQSLSTREKHDLDFTVLSDVGLKAAREYGIVFTLPDAVRAAYAEHFDMADYNGVDTGELPLGATYVIDRDATIRWAFLSADYRERAEPGEVLAALRKIAKPETN